MDNIKVYLLCGKARCGKDTVGNIIKEYLENKNHKVCEIQVMRTLKGYLKDYFNWDGKEETKPRKLLQQMGYDVIRESNPNFHLDRLIEDINVLSKYFDTFTVNDIRLPYEIDYLRKKFNNITVIGIVKENYVSPLDEIEEKHITEHALDDYNDYDYKIINNDIDKLKQDVRSILEGGK